MTRPYRWLWARAAVGACSALAVALVSARAAAYCRGVAEDAPPGYDPAVSGCFGAGLDLLYWKNQCVGYSLQQDASRQVALQDATAIASQAFGAWSAVSCAGTGSPSLRAVDLGPVACGAVGYSRDGANQHVIVFRDDGWPYDDSSNTLALTTITYDVTDGEIVDADTEVNSHDYTLVTSGDDPPPGSYDLLTILTHEAGHFLGLAHSQDTSALMYAHYHSVTALTADDVSGICAIYPPSGVRSTTKGPVPGEACDPTPLSGFSGQCGAPPDAGTPDAGRPGMPDAGGAASTRGGCAVGGSREPAQGEALFVALVALSLGRRRRSRGAIRLASRCAGAAALSALVGCADTSAEGPPQVPGPDAAARARDARAEAAVDDGALRGEAPPADVSSPRAGRVRIANWSPGAPAIDFCLATHGTTDFRGPMLAALERSLADSGLLDDAGLAGVAFPLASAYVTVPPDPYDARFVVAGASDCSVGVGPDAISLPTLAADAFETIALLGEISPAHGAPGLRALGLEDEGLPPPAPSDGGPSLAIRFVNAAPIEPTITASLATLVQGLFNGVVFGAPGASKTVDPPLIADANGYVTVGPFVAETVSAFGIDSSGAQAFLIKTTASLASGASVTIVLVGDSVTAAAGSSPVQLIACVDNAAVASPTGTCAVLEEAEP